jgi:hypothetical protein
LKKKKIKFSKNGKLKMIKKELKEKQRQKLIKKEENIMQINLKNIKKMKSMVKKKNLHLNII